jgi:4-amino-4-deoxy-L-arabinose transferase-like glycosyltransferase
VDIRETEHAQAGHSEKLVVITLCLAAAIRVFVFSAAFPFFNNVDEQAHVDLVLKYGRGHWPNRPVEHFDFDAGRLFVLYGTPEYLNGPEKFPGGVVPRPPAATNDAVDQAATSWMQEINHEANSPPAYYVLAGVWYDVGKILGLTPGNHLYWMRFLNVPLIVLLVACAYVLCRGLYRDRLDLRLGVSALVAFLPQDVFYSVNSDVLSPLMFALSLLLLWRWHEQERPGAALSAIVGLLVALTFLVKYTNVALLPTFGMMVFLKTRRLRLSKRWKDALAPASIALTSAIVPIAALLTRNYLQLGELMGTHAKVEYLGWSRRPFGSVMAHPIFTASGFWRFWSGLMETFWRGEFVWHMKRIANPLADDFYAISSLVLLIAAAAAWHQRKTTKASDGPDAAVWASVILSVLCLAFLSVWFEYGPSFFPSQKEPYFTSGRLIAGALVPFMILYVDGIAFLLRRFFPIAGSLVCVALISLMMTVSELVLSWHIFTNPYNWFHLR